MNILSKYYEKDNLRQNRECVIILEGIDDIFFISKLIENLDANPNYVGLVQVGGTTRFKERLELFFKQPHFTQGKNKSVAIICDSDNNHLKKQNNQHHSPVNIPLTKKVQKLVYLLYRNQKIMVIWKNFA